MLTNIKLHLNYLSITVVMRYWSLTFATQMLFRHSGSELFDTFKNIILLRIFPLYSWKIPRQLKWQIPGELLTARYNWCHGPVPGRGPAVEKHCSKPTPVAAVLLFSAPYYASYLHGRPVNPTRSFIQVSKSCKLILGQTITATQFKKHHSRLRFRFHSTWPQVVEAILWTM
jgi:hypothetical protein